jgi:hypothetical protein
VRPTSWVWTSSAHDQVSTAPGITMTTSDSIPSAGRGPLLDAHQIFQHEPSQTQRQPSWSSRASSTDAATRGKRNSMNRPMAHSASSRNTQSSTSTHSENRAAQRDVRTLPRKFTCLYHGTVVCPTNLGPYTPLFREENMIKWMGI